MDIRELKQQIESHSLSDDALILIYSDNKFLCQQYIQEIARYKNKDICYIKSTKEIEDRDIFFYTENILYILDIDKFEEQLNIFPKNLIIICKEVKENIAIEKISVPKILPWQIEAFITTQLQGLNKIEIEWLCKICKYDIYRLVNESKKINIFKSSYQEKIFNDINTDNGYADLDVYVIYDFTNAFVRKDLLTINKILTNIENIDIEGTGVVTLLRRQFLNMINIQLNPKASPELLNMSYKQFKAIQYNCKGKFNNVELINIFEFLTSIDARLKNGDLQMSNQRLIDYITQGILCGGK